MKSWADLPRDGVISMENIWLNFSKIRSFSCAILRSGTGIIIGQHGTELSGLLGQMAKRFGFRSTIR